MYSIHLKVFRRTTLRYKYSVCKLVLLEQFKVYRDLHERKAKLNCCLVLHTLIINIILYSFYPLIG